jgi:amino acid transporter
MGAVRNMGAVRKMGFWPLVAATYFMVSGGPYGLEELVGRGYGVALIALVITPWLWSVPTAMMVGELASAIPDEGGYYAWVRRALGPFWGFQEAWLSLVASVFDMALYPILFALYLGRLVPPWSEGQAPVVIASLVVVASAAWNVRGAASVGRGSVALGGLLLAPFAVLIGLALAHRGPSVAVPVPVPERTGGPLGGVLIAMWNYMGWDNASTIAGEVDHPDRTYPRAVFVTVALVTLTYVLPVAAMGIAGIDPRGWTTGAWVDAARDLGGPRLAFAVAVGGMVCGAGMFSALLLSYSRLPAVLADEGRLPRWLARRAPDGGAPWASVVACSVAYVACLGIGFSHLVALDVLLYGMSLTLEFVALVVLRVREPSLLRPYKVPGGTIAAAVLGIPPALILAVASWACRHEAVGPIPSLAVGAVLVGIGPILYRAGRVGSRGALLDE